MMFCVNKIHTCNNRLFTFIAKPRYLLPKSQNSLSFSITASLHSSLISDNNQWCFEIAWEVANKV